jgi:hypothetical protein
MMQGVAMMQQLAAANIKGGRLLELVRANIPQWRQQGIGLGDALRRWWPGGRA